MRESGATVGIGSIIRSAVAALAPLIISFRVKTLALESRTDIPRTTDLGQLKLLWILHGRIKSPTMSLETIYAKRLCTW